MPVEIKSGQTLNRDFFTGLERWTALAGAMARGQGGRTRFRVPVWSDQLVKAMLKADYGLLWGRMNQAAVEDPYLHIG